MKIDISARHFQVTAPLKAYIVEKIEKLDKYFLKLEKAHVILEVQKFNHNAEITLGGKNLNITAKDKSKDMYAAFDKCFGKVQLQIQRKHDKVRDHKPRRYAVKSKTPSE